MRTYPQVIRKLSTGYPQVIHRNSDMILHDGIDVMMTT